MAPVRVIVADDDVEVREAVGDLLRNEPGFQVVGLAADAVEAVELAVRESPDVALLDVKMPLGGGERAAREIRALCPLTRILALSAYEDRPTVLAMLSAGAHGYLAKSASADEIIAGINRCVAGGGVLANEITADVIDELATHLERDQAATLRREEHLAPLREVLADPGHLLTILFQPIVDLQSGAVAGAEALARFKVNPQRPPDVWLADAAALNLVLDLELALLRRALASINAIPRPAYLAVNLSPETAMSTAFAEILDGVPADRLVLEVTEHVPVLDYAQLARKLDDLRRRGARLAIDDAGAGYASLRHILRLSPDIIKLDISLTRSIDTDRPRRALAAGLIGFAREIEAAIVAEGIETAAEVAALVQLGVRFGQGFYLHRPGPLPVPGRVRAMTRLGSKVPWRHPGQEVR